MWHGVGIITSPADVKRTMNKPNAVSNPGEKAVEEYLEVYLGSRLYNTEAVLKKDRPDCTCLHQDVACLVFQLAFGSWYHDTLTKIKKNIYESLLLTIGKI